MESNKVFKHMDKVFKHMDKVFKGMDKAFDKIKNFKFSSLMDVETIISNIDGKITIVGKVKSVTINGKRIKNIEKFKQEKKE